MLCLRLTSDRVGSPAQEGYRGETGHPPAGVQPAPGQETPFSFVSSLEGLGGGFPPRVRQVVPTLLPVRENRRTGEPRGLSSSSPLPGDLFMALGPLAEGELTVGTPELCTPVKSSPGRGCFPYPTF